MAKNFSLNSWFEAKAFRTEVELESQLEKSKYAKLQAVEWSTGTSRHVPVPHRRYKIPALGFEVLGVVSVWRKEKSSRQQQHGWSLVVVASGMALEVVAVAGAVVP